MELIGRQFGHIRVTEVVGEGGMGAVYAGHDEKLDRKVALKVLHADQRLDEEARERLLREARALSKVDHPNICRIHDYIETGDVDLLVLEYIDGRTLQAAIDNGLAHTEKLRIALAVAEVLVRAHRAGIVHRDLKPENVMLTKADEVKVLDFGLARWLHRSRKSSDSHQAAPSLLRVDANQKPGSGNGGNAHDSTVGETMALPSARPSDIFPTGRREFLATAVGITLGTPLYMSPEQARGEALTPASDMFSFGLLLQVLFTGKEPHADVMSAREVILRVARGETNPVEGAPKDIAALINQLKMYAPADRPTAVQMVERLRYQIDKPQRIARRSIAGGVAVMMLFGGWRYTVDLDRERTSAVVARTDAENRRAQAEDLISFMVNDLRTKLEPVGRLEVLDDVANKALQYYSETDPQRISTTELITHSKALNQLGEVRIGLGSVTTAIPLFDRSLNRAAAAVKREPSNAEAQFALALSRFWLAHSHRLRGDLASATKHCQVYLAVTTDLARRYPATDKYQLELAYAHSQKGMILEAERNANGAISEYRKALDIKNAHAARHRDDDAAREDVARTMNKLGFAMQKNGELEAARQQFQDEVAIREQLVARQPKQTRWVHALANAHTFLGYVLEDLGDPQGAERHRLAHVALMTDLVKLDPSNVTWQQSLVAGQSGLARLFLTSGDLAQASRYVQLAEPAYRALIAKEPSRPQWRSYLSNLQTNSARILLAQGRTDQARSKAEEAIRTVEGNKDRASLKSLGVARLVLGAIHEAQGNQAAATRERLSAVDLLKATPNTTEVRDLENWARLLMALDRRDEAAAVIARLRGFGYKNSDFETLVKSEGY